MREIDLNKVIMNLRITCERYLHWLNTYAFIGWCLELGEYSLDELIEIAEKEDERYDYLLSEFAKAKTKALLKPEDVENDKS